jgi:hypothetical protein
MRAPARSLLGTICTFLLLTIGAFAQQSSPNAPQDDRTDSSVLRERAQAAGQQSQDRGGAQQSDPRARLEWRLQERGAPSVAFKQHLMQLWQAQAAQRGAPDAAINATSGPQWVPIGPTGADYEQNGSFTGFVRDSGRARTILPHPTDSDTVYFLTSGGGLWVTNNFTATQSTWRPLTDSLVTTSGGSVAFGRTPSVLYLGLGDPFDVINVGGVMAKSIDGGVTWTNIVDLGFPFSVRDVKVDTSGTQDIVLVATDQGLFRSIDGGVTYAVATGPDLTFQIMGFWSLVQTSAGWLTNAKQCPIGVAICASPGALYISTDHGATWRLITNTGNVYTGAGRTTVAVGAPSDSIVYAFAENSFSSDQLDLFRSTNGGQDWTALNINPKIPSNPNSDNPNMDLMHGQSFYNQMILVDPRDINRNTIYLGGNLSTAVSKDGGNTWTLLSNWLFDQANLRRIGLPYVHADAHAAAISNVPGATPALLFGNDGGLFVSTNGGTTWSSEKNNGLQTFLFYSLTSTPGFPSSVMGGTQDNGTRVRKGNTTIFNQSLGGDGLGTGWSQANTNTSIATAQGNSYGVNLTNQVPDINENFLRTRPPLINDAVFSTPVETPPPTADPTGKVFFTSSRLQVYETIDGGLTWTVIGSVGAATHTILAGTTLRSTAHAVGVSPVDLLHVGVIASGGHVEITTDGGNTWTDRALNTLVSGFQTGISTASITWADNQTIYVTSVVPLTGAPRVVKSIDGGVSWARADSGVPDVPTDRVIIDPRDSTRNTLLAASDSGVFRSTDGGASWAPYGTGLPDAFVSDIYMPPDGSFLRIATHGRGIWELPFLTFGGATLTDDVASCDNDGALDNGESGHLTITLHNDGTTPLSGVTATVTSTNPSVHFPNGNTLNFAAAAAGANTTAAIVVKLSGATGIQQIDFTIAFTDPALGLPAPVTAIASFRANYNEIPNGSANDNIEGTNSPWTVTGTAPSTPDIVTWQRRQISPVEHRWAAVDSNAATDVSLVSPVLQVGTGNFTVSFEQRYVFEFNGGTTPAWFDGMVIEASKDGGATWTDIGVNASPTYDHVLATGGGNVLEGRQAYSGTSVGYPNFVSVTVSLGVQYAGQNVQIRFRVGTDIATGRPGVEIRNITTTGLTNTPFTAVVASIGVCLTSTSLTSSKNPSFFGDVVTFGATVTSGLTVATGNITFNDAATSIGTGALNGTGQATLGTSSLSVGLHTITATYGGDSTHATSTSSAVTQTVNKAPTVTTIASSLNPAPVGQSITFTATVTSSGGTPTGLATFFNACPVPSPSPCAATVIGIGTLNAQGVATFSTAALSQGSHSIVATYGGDANFAVSASTALTEVIPNFTVNASPSSQTVVAGQPATFTFTVTPVNLSTETITFACGPLPAKITCGFAPASVMLNGTQPASSTATVQTMANAALPFSPRPSSRAPASRTLALVGIWALALLSFAVVVRRLPRRVAFTSALLCGLALSLASCSSSSSSSGPSGTPPGTYTISLSATSSGGTSLATSVSVVVH